MKTRFLFTAFLALFFAGLAKSPSGDVRAQGLFENDNLVIKTASGIQHKFSIEVAVTDIARQRGLMFRESMPANHGMLFDYGRPTRASMWMKNTLIPLDMLFIKSDGTIESIAQRTVPLSLDAVSAKGRVRGVLELNGGTASRLKLNPGDVVHHAIFKNAKD